MFRHDEKQRSQDEKMQRRFPQQPRAATPLHSFRTGIDAQSQWAVVSSMLCVRERIAVTLPSSSMPYFLMQLFGVYQIGDDQARSCNVSALSVGKGRP